MVIIHEFPSFEILDNASFSADRFGNEKGFGFGVVKASRVKLDELHIRDRGSGAIGHRHAIAGRNVWVGGVEVNLSAASGSDNDCVCPEGFDLLALGVEDVHALTMVGTRKFEAMGRDKIDGEMVFKDVDIGIRGNRVEEGSFDFASRDILGVENPTLRVSAFFSQIPLALSRFQIPFAKLHAESDQVLDATGAFAQDLPDDLLIAESRSGIAGILDMFLDGILFARDGGDAALGVVGVGFSPVLFGDDGHSTSFRDLEREVESGNAASEDDKVVVSSHHGNLGKAN